MIAFEYFLIAFCGAFYQTSTLKFFQNHFRIMQNQNTANRRAWRASISEEERARIRGSDTAARRESRARKRTAECDELVHCDMEMLQDIDEQLAFHPLTDAVSNEVYARSMKALSNAEMSEIVCCCCDAFAPASASRRADLNKSSGLLRNMKNRLKAPDDLCFRLLNEYDVSDIDQRLQGLLLSRRGVTKNQDGSVVLVLCRSCSTSLARKLESPPKFAIANGLFMGTLPPEYADTTMTEHSMVDLSQATHYVSAVRGGCHRVLRSHSYCFRSRPMVPAELLPRNIIDATTLRVTIVGSATTRQEARTKTKYEVRGERLKQLLIFYKDHNKYYQNVDVRDDQDPVYADTRVVCKCIWIPDSLLQN